MEGGCRAIFKWDSDRPAFHLTIHTRVGCPVRVRPLLLPLPPALRYGCLRLQSRLVGKLRAMVPRSRLGAESGTAPHPRSSPTCDRFCPFSLGDLPPALPRLLSFISFLGRPGQSPQSPHPRTTDTHSLRGLAADIGRQV